jgi:hypothetical protein
MAYDNLTAYVMRFQDMERVSFFLEGNKSKKISYNVVHPGLRQHQHKAHQTKMREKESHLNWIIIDIRES